MKIKKFNISKLRNVAFIGLFLLSTTSCLNDLDVRVDDDELFTSEQFYANPASYKQFLAKIYGGLAGVLARYGINVPPEIITPQELAAHKAKIASIRKG